MLEELRAEVTIVVVGLLGYLPGLGSFPTSLDERIYAAIAREMAVGGHWLIPRYTGEADVVAGTVFLEKPPLVFWVQALSVELFGATTFAVRLPSALATVACAVVVYRIGARLYDASTGVAAGFVFLAAPAVFWYGNGGRTATTDPFLTLFGTLFVWFLWRARDESRYLVYAGVAGGLAVMSKQVAAGVYLLVALPLVVRVVRDAELRTVAGAVGAWCLVVVPWNVVAAVSYPDRYVRQMILEQVFGRVGTGQAPVHGSGGWTVGPFNPFYLLQFPGYLGPFALSTAGGVALVARDVRTGDRRRAGLFCCWWLLFPLAFFTVATSATWIHYVQASVVPAAVLSGYAVARAVWWLDAYASRTTGFPGLPYVGYVAAAAVVTLAVFVLYPAHQNAVV